MVLGLVVAGSIVFAAAGCASGFAVAGSVAAGFKALGLVAAGAVVRFKQHRVHFPDAAETTSVIQDCRMQRCQTRCGESRGYVHAVSSRCKNQPNLIIKLL